MHSPGDITPRPASPVASSVPSVQLAVLLTGYFMANFDFFVVNVAAPSIQRDLSASSGQLELIVGAYALSYASGLVLGGRLGDEVGHRHVFMAGMVAFAAASTFCGVADRPGTLILARLLQGLSAAAMLPQVLAIISAQTRGSGRAHAMAWYGVAGGLGSLAGQAVGGLLIDADIEGLGWRLIFLVNLPIGLAGAAAATCVSVSVDERRRAGRTWDLGGAIGLAAGIALLMVPLSVGRDDGWPMWTWVCLGTALPVLGVTAAWQWSLEQRGRQPLLPVHLFSVPAFRVGVLSTAAFMVMFASYMFGLALLLQAGYGLSALQAGLAFAPSGVTFLSSALLVPRLPTGLRRYALVAGALTSAVALTSICIVARADANQSLLGIVVATAAVASLGNGAVLPSLLGLTLSGVPARDAGAGAGALATAQQFSAAAGVTVLGTLFFAAAGSPVRTGAGRGMSWVAGVGAALSVIIAVGGAALQRAVDPPVEAHD